MESGMHLVTGVWVSPNDRRMMELMECLDANLKNSYITSVQLVIQQPTDEFMTTMSAPPNQGVRWLADRLVHPKVKLVQLGRRPTFEQLFGYAADEAPGRMAIVASSDLAFDNSLEAIQKMDLEKTLVCLSAGGGKNGFPPEVAQAAWIFRAPLPKFPCDWHPGQLGSDNKLAWAAAKADLTIVNPCFSVVATQRMPKEGPDWPLKPRLEGPYLNVYPVEAASIRRQAK